MPELNSEAFEGATTVAYTTPRRVEPTGILHFTIGVTDLERAYDFYVDVVGCTFWRRNDTTMFMRAGDDFFVLSRTGYHQPPNKGTDSLIHHAFMVTAEDFDAAKRCSRPRRRKSHMPMRYPKARLPWPVAQPRQALPATLPLEPRPTMN